MTPLRRLWFRFERLLEPTALNLGCGITAYSYDDALSILAEQVFPGGDVPPIVECIQDVDVSTLGDKHVRPNMGGVVYRGVWASLGYETS